MSARHALLSLLLLSVFVGCSSQPAESKANSGTAAAKAQQPEPAAAPKAAAPLYERTSASAPAPVLDPARVPVEEDFIEGAEQRIGKKSNLEQEIQRLAAEIHTAAQAE